MRSVRLLIAALVLAAPLALAAPSGAQEPFEITGDAICNDDGTYTVFWEITNLLGIRGRVDIAEVTGAVEADVTFSPNPIPTDETASASLNVPGDTSGEVVLYVFINFEKSNIDDDFALELEGDCEAIVTTTTSTTLAPTTSTTAPAARPLTIAPAFTG